MRPRSHLDARLASRRQRRACHQPRVDLRLRTVVLCALIALACIGLARAVRGETLWQLVSCPPTEACRVRGPALPKTACELDMWSESFVAPKATRLRCERVTPARESAR